MATPKRLGEMGVPHLFAVLSKEPGVSPARTMRVAFALIEGYPSIYFDPGVLVLWQRAGASFLSTTFFVFPGLGINGGPAGEDGSGQSTARSEFAADEAPLRANGFDDIVENFVHGVFVEDPQAAVGEEIHFQGLQLEAILGGQVLDAAGPGDGPARCRSERG